MKIRCLKCGRVFSVGAFWEHAECPGCGVRIHHLNDGFETWEPLPVTQYEQWACWACESQFEVWPHTDHCQCPHCGSRVYRTGSYIAPVGQEVIS